MSPWWRRASPVVLIVALLVVVPALAGCTAPDPAPEGDGDAATAEGAAESGAGGEGDGEVGNTTGPPGVPTRLHFGGCTVQSTTFTVPSLVLEEDVPDGFSLVHADPAGLTALMGMAAFDCGNATGEGVQAGGYAELSVFAYVEPPAEHSDASADGHLLQFFSVVSDEAVAGVYAQWGHWVDAGTVQVETTDAVAARVGRASAEDEFQRWELHTVVENALPECWDRFGVRSFSHGPEGIVGYVDMEFSAACALTGTGKAVLPDPWSTDPMDVVFWGIINTLLTGVANHFVGDALDISQEYTRFAS